MTRLLLAVSLLLTGCAGRALVVPVDFKLKPAVELGLSQEGPAMWTNPFVVLVGITVLVFLYAVLRVNRTRTS